MTLCLRWLIFFSESLKRQIWNDISLSLIIIDLKKKKILVYLIRIFKTHQIIDEKLNKKQTMSPRSIDNNSYSLVVVLDYSAAPGRIVKYAKIKMRKAATELYGGFFSRLQPRQRNGGKATRLENLESDVQNLKNSRLSSQLSGFSIITLFRLKLKKNSACLSLSIWQFCPALMSSPGPQREYCYCHRRGCKATG